MKSFRFSTGYSMLDVIKAKVNLMLRYLNNKLFPNTRQEGIQNVCSNQP